MMDTLQSVILDCDNTMGLPYKEIDDGLTLLYLLGRPELNVVGVTTTFGNGSMEQAYYQTRALLSRVNRAGIPCWRGQERPGNLANDSARFLAETAAEQPGKISILATGPLTNLLAAARLDPRFFQNVAQIACMGGLLEPLQIGWRKLAELNLSADPQASHAVLNAGCPVTLMTAQLCLQASFDWRDLVRIRNLPFWLRRSVRHWLLSFGLYCGVGRFFLWDLAPAVYLSFPHLFDVQTVFVTSTVNDLATGNINLGLCPDSAAQLQMPARILDRSRFKQVIIESWANALETSR